MNRKFLSIIVIPAIIASCTGAPKPKSGGPLPLPQLLEPVVFRKFFPSPPSTIDPLRAFDVNSGHLITQIYDTLFELDSSLALRPHLAESYSYDPQKKEYHIVLRRDVFFSNGDQLTSADVVFTLGRFCRDGRGDWKITKVIAGCAGSVRGNRQLSGVRSEGPHGVVIQLNHHYPLFLYNIASHNFAVIRNGFGGLEEADYWRRPIATGAYVLDKMDDTAVILHANSRYFLGKPTIDIVNYTITSFDVAENMAREQRLDDTWPLSIKNPSPDFYQSYKGHFAKVCFIGFNLQKYPYSNYWFRRALDLLIDKQEIMNLIRSDEIIAAKGFIPYGVLGYLDDLEDSKRDLTLADVYMKKAGFSNYAKVPPLTLYTTESQWMEKFDERVAEQLRTVGLRVTVVRESLRDHLRRVRLGQVDFALVMIQLNQPETYHLLEFFKSDHPLRPFRAADQQYDQLLEESQLIEDRMQRAEIYQRANRFIFDHAWTINFFYDIYKTGYVNKQFRMPMMNYLGPEFARVREITFNDPPL